MSVMSNGYNVSEFRFLRTVDECQEKYTDWSRLYEYPWVHKWLAGQAMLNSGVTNEWYNHVYGDKDKQQGCWPHLPLIHNTACGPESLFRRELSSLYPCVHSDHVPGHPSSPAMVYDLMDAEYADCFDTVLCISTLEHLPPDDQPVAMQNLLRQVRPGGCCLMTFDYPRVNLEMVENFVGTTCHRFDDELNTANSKIPCPDRPGLSVCVLAIHREEIDVSNIS